MKPKVFFASNVFSMNEIGKNTKMEESIRHKIQSSWEILKSIAVIKSTEKRFPTTRELQDAIDNFNPNIIGCHLSHSITKEMQEIPNLFAVSTAT
ncbi:MAG: hypothetical protein EU533_07770, partial [Promethearchaeota archaeon]